MADWEVEGLNLQDRGAEQIFTFILTRSSMNKACTRTFNT